MLIRGTVAGDTRHPWMARARPSPTEATCLLSLDQRYPRHHILDHDGRIQRCHPKSEVRVRNQWHRDALATRREHVSLADSCERLHWDHEELPTACPFISRPFRKETIFACGVMLRRHSRDVQAMSNSRDDVDIRLFLSRIRGLTSPSTVEYCFSTWANG